VRLFSSKVPKPEIKAIALRGGAPKIQGLRLGRRNGDGGYELISTLKAIASLIYNNGPFLRASRRPRESMGMSHFIVKSFIYV